MRKVLGFAAICVTLVACAAAPATEKGPLEVAGLDGKTITVDEGDTSSTPASPTTHVSVDGQPMDVSFDGAKLRVTMGARALELRQSRAGFVGVEYDDAEHGEHVTFEVPAASVSSEAALTAARGHVAAAQLKRHGVLAPAATLAISGWDGARKAAADSLLASWVATLPHLGDVATGAAGAVKPRWLGDEGVYQIESTCDQGTSCSIRDSSGYSCSATCKQGWFGGQNCATCTVGAGGGVSCGCDW